MNPNNNAETGLLKELHFEHYLKKVTRKKTR